MEDLLPTNPTLALFAFKKLSSLFMEQKRNLCVEESNDLPL